MESALFVSVPFAIKIFQDTKINHFSLVEWIKCRIFASKSCAIHFEEMGFAPFKQMSVRRLREACLSLYVSTNTPYRANCITILRAQPLGRVTPSFVFYNF